MAKPRVAFFDFASCEGDQLTVINLEEQLLEVLKLVDVVSFREAMKEHSDDYDIAFIEGSCTREQDEERLKKIRANAKLVVAIGACATMGGINSIKNTRPLEQVRREVYGDKWQDYPTYATRGIDKVIKVDAYVHGCPMTKSEFVKVVKALLAGTKPDIPDYPVCVDCKKAGNVCVFEKGQTCVGPITRAGCNACCVTEGAVCWGCRGLIPNPNVDAHKEVLEKYGLTVDELKNKFNLYFGGEKLA
ncbi:MAG TPA: NADH:ubiquinone oxidoreductase [bacterium]|nr:NADH:ubiquinone oxidoreductase [bacterium]